MDVETAVDRHIDGRSRSQWLDAQLAALAARQHGVISLSQLVLLGFGRGAVELRLRSGRLHLVHRGVYAVGLRKLTREGTWMAAVLAAGGGAVLSHRDAAAAHALLRADYGPIHITSPRKLHSRPGLRLHHRCLTAEEIVALDGIPTTAVARTILDLAATEPRRAVERAIHEAEVHRVLDLREIAAAVNRSPHAKGVRAVRSVLAERDARAAHTREELEERFIAFLVDERLPLPKTNVRLRVGRGWIEADCAWFEQKVIAELDGWAVHGTRRRFESDRERDRALHVAGWRPIRVTWRQLHDGRPELAADLRELLAIPRRRPGRRSRRHSS
jgi:predicted transcriptional regulator of viral defense system